jgi:hypothetical protein
MHQFGVKADLQLPLRDNVARTRKFPSFDLPIAGNRRFCDGACRRGPTIRRSDTQNESSQASCLRWMLRGLDCKKAIRKVQTDLEISEKAITKWKK